MESNHTLGTRREPRVSTDSAADIYKASDPYWKATGRVANVSANGLLLNVEEPAGDVEIGAKLSVRFGAAAVAGKVKHVSDRNGRTLVGMVIDDVQYL
jgi:hypothetical protein